MCVVAFIREIKRVGSTGRFTTAPVLFMYSSRTDAQTGLNESEALALIPRAKKERPDVISPRWMGLREVPFPYNAAYIYGP